MQRRLAAALASAALAGPLAACGAPDHGAPRHIVAVETRATDLHDTVAALDVVRAAVVRPPSRASRSGSRPRVSGDVWGALARCESNMRNDTGPPYYGYFQFSPATWKGLGYQGLPSDHDYGTQLAAAQRLVARSGWGQFPGCARRLGLR